MARWDSGIGFDRGARGRRASVVARYPRVASCQGATPRESAHGYPVDPVGAVGRIASHDASSATVPARNRPNGAVGATRRDADEIQIPAGAHIWPCSRPHRICDAQTPAHPETPTRANVGTKEAGSRQHREVHSRCGRDGAGNRGRSPRGADHCRAGLRSDRRSGAHRAHDIRRPTTVNNVNKCIRCTPLTCDWLPRRVEVRGLPNNGPQRKPTGVLRRPTGVLRWRPTASYDEVNE